jgi:hypothetical protein
VPFGWTREVEADAYGGMLALQATFRHKVPPGLAALTVECGQIVRVLVDRAREVLETGGVAEVRAEGSSSHPPAEIRLELLRHALDILTHINPVLSGVAEAHDISDGFLDVLRSAVDAASLKARGRGARPLVPLRRDQHAATP